VESVELQSQQFAAVDPASSYRLRSPRPGEAGEAQPGPGRPVHREPEALLGRGVGNPQAVSGLGAGISSGSIT